MTANWDNASDLYTVSQDARTDVRFFDDQKGAIELAKELAKENYFEECKVIWLKPEMTGGKRRWVQDATIMVHA